MALPVIKIENAKGQVLNLSSDPRYYVELTGAGPPPATINRTKMAAVDGTRYNSSTVDERNLVLLITLLRDVGRARQNLYKYAPSKGYAKVHYQLDDLSVYAEGYVETVETDPHALGQTVQISIICPYPFWIAESETYTDASDVDDLLEFPFAIEEEGVELSTIDVTASAEINNAGQVPTGARFELYVLVRTLQPRIYNLETGEWMGFYADLLAGDRLIIDTAQGRKSVTHLREGVRTNYINTIMPGSTWLQLAPGVNEYSYTLDEGEATLEIFHTDKYLGV